VTDERDGKAAPRGPLWREIVILLGVAVVVAVLVRTLLLQTFYIPSESMQPTLEVYDRVLVNKLVYRFREPDRGEVVVFEAPLEWRSNPSEKDFIKRVIAVGGDTVACCAPGNRLIINGQPLDEPYLFRDANGVPDPAAPMEFEVVVPEGRLWVLGDHRSWSGDSMDHYRTSGDVDAATISVDSVIGRAFLRYWPLDRIGWLSVPDEFDAVPDAAPAPSGRPPERDGSALAASARPGL
jgi:signal peptidase I